LPTFAVIVDDVRNLSLAAEGSETWRLLTFAVTIDDVRNPRLAIEDLGSWCPLALTVIIADDVEIQAYC